ncbi:MAG: hypothetical protein K2Q03_05755 [Sphingobacteriaceae bacterium]|nr:hypothetical protein [Sphingobacteriaceae bacterium]
MKLTKETKEIADNLLANGKKVFVNTAGEIFTDESYAKASGYSYEVFEESLDEEEKKAPKKANKKAPVKKEETASNEEDEKTEQEPIKSE